MRGSHTRSRGYRGHCPSEAPAEGGHHTSVRSTDGSTRLVATGPRCLGTIGAEARIHVSQIVPKRNKNKPAGGEDPFQTPKETTLPKSPAPEHVWNGGRRQAHEEQQGPQTLGGWADLSTGPPADAGSPVALWSMQHEGREQPPTRGGHRLESEIARHSTLPRSRPGGQASAWGQHCFRNSHSEHETFTRQVH